MRTRIIVVPYDSGVCDARMGAGPRRLVKGIAEALRSGDRVAIDEVSVERRAPGELAITIDVLKALAARVSSARADGEFPLVLAGNCNSSLGTVAGLQASGASAIGVCWFDAHGDFNTPETTTSGFIDGMALAMLTGRCWAQFTQGIPGFSAIDENRVSLIGTRDLDPQEVKLLDGSAVRRVAASADATAVTRPALKTMSGADEIYLHLDLDVLDTSEGRANQYACGGGLTRATLLDVVRGISASNRVHAMALTAYDPASDDDGRIAAIAIDAAKAALAT